MLQVTRGPVYSCIAVTVGGGVWYQGGVYRWVPGWAIPGTTQTPRFARGECPVQRSGPRKPARAGVGGTGCSDVRAAGRLLYHPCGAPVGLLRSPPCTGPLGMPPWANRARIDLISLKLSQNGQVSPKFIEKACLSPYIQKRVPKVTS